MRIDVLVSGQIVGKGKMPAHQGLELYHALAYKADGIHIVLVAIHHGGVQIQFGVVELGQITVGQASVHRNQDDDASLPGVLDGLIHGGVIARAVVDDVRLVGAEALRQSRAKGAGFGVDSVIRSAGAGQLQPIVGDIGGHDLGRAKGLQGLNQQNADRAAAQHAYLLARYVPRPPGGVHRDGQRLQHGALVIAHSRRQRRHL